MNENERDFKKVLESINSLESKITNLENFVRQKLIRVHELDKESLNNQHKINLDYHRQIGQILNLISLQSDKIEDIKGKISD